MDLDRILNDIRAAGQEMVVDTDWLLRSLTELRAAREELAELRELAAGSYTVGCTWSDGEPLPDDYVLTDEDGDFVDLAVDASGLVRAALERQGELHRRELVERWSQLQLLNAELGTAREELATAQRRLWLSERELRQLRDALEDPDHYQLGGAWSDDGPVPADYVLLNDDGNPVEVDGLEVRGDLLVRAVLDRARQRHQQQLREALEQQAAVWVRAAEETPAVLLEQLLAMVGRGWDLVADSQSSRRAPFFAAWFRGGAATGRKLEEHRGHGADCAAAIRAATVALLRGRQKCGTCAHWGAPGDEGGDKECLATALRLRKTAESSCGESWRPAQWLEPEPELPVSPGRLVRAALAYVDSIPFPGAGPELELWQAAAELRGTEPESGDGEGGQC